ncbi:cache domain-containing protein [Mycobacterium sp. SMC-4]|uniref:cache domain-containing protein n=1 Tax=Mycobacterium sp. SMC-4 TaxID=2857059 RepID=UPI003D05E522
MSEETWETDLKKAAAEVGAVVEGIFTVLRDGAEDAARLWSRIADDTGTVRTVDLAALRTPIEARLESHRYFDGTGLVVDPSALRDAERYQEWWRPSVAGGYEFLDVNIGFGEEPYDYTGMSWFVGAARGLDSVRGPYVDLSGSDLYVLTFAVPAKVNDTFIGVSGADITVANFESLVIGELSALDSEVVVVNSADRVVISSSPDYFPGERMRAAGNRDTHIGGPGVNWRVHRV